LILGWFNFQLWINRTKKVLEDSGKDDEFVAIPVFSHLIQTFGEWLGFTLGTIGFSTTLLVNVFFKEYDRYFFGRIFGTELLNPSFKYIIIWPLAGYLIIVIFRVIAEIYRAIASIANNTKKFAPDHSAERL